MEPIEMRDGAMRNRGFLFVRIQQQGFPNFLVRLKTRDDPLNATKNGLLAARQFRKGAALARSHGLNTRPKVSEMVPEGNTEVRLHWVP
jgi:hypothetical protein